MAGDELIHYADASADKLVLRSTAQLSQIGAVEVEI
jgi:hypothetical protein